MDISRKLEPTENGLFGGKLRDIRAGKTASLMGFNEGG
jgi:hypothetical protein